MSESSFRPCGFGRLGRAWLSLLVPLAFTLWLWLRWNPDFRPRGLPGAIDGYASGGMQGEGDAEIAGVADEG